MSFPENLSDRQFYHENPPYISVVHSRTSQATQLSQHTNSTSPLPSPLHQLHHPQVGGQQSHTYTVRSNSHGSIEPHKFSFKHNQGGGVRGQNHSQGNFSPQRRFVPQGHNIAPGFRNQQQQYNQNTWRRRKRDSAPALNQSRWKTEAAEFGLISIGSPSWEFLSFWFVLFFLFLFYFFLIEGSQERTYIVLEFPSQFKLSPIVSDDHC